MLNFVKYCHYYYYYYYDHYPELGPKAKELDPNSGRPSRRPFTLTITSTITTIIVSINIIISIITTISITITPVFLARTTRLLQVRETSAWPAVDPHSENSLGRRTVTKLYHSRLYIIMITICIIMIVVCYYYYH